MFRIVVVKREKPLSKPVVSLIALLIGLFLSIIILYVLSSGAIDPYIVLHSIWDALSSPNLLIKNFCLLTIVGVGLVISFKASIWNIGGEGQFYLAIIAATWVALYSGVGTIVFVNKFLMLLLGIISAGLWTLLASLPRSLFNVDEVPVTLLMNYIAYYIVDYLVDNPWRDPYYRYSRTPTLPQESWFSLIPGTSVSPELLVIAFTTLLFAWILLNYTYIGLYIRVMGSNPQVLRVTGVNVSRLIIYGLMISGMVIGVAGVSYLASTAHLITVPAETRTPGLGYIGILVAWLSMLEIIYVPLIAYVLSTLIITSINLQIYGVGGSSIEYVFIGSMMLTYALLIVLREYRIRFMWGRGE